jgi:hypothetical protein
LVETAGRCRAPAGGEVLAGNTKLQLGAGYTAAEAPLFCGGGEMILNTEGDPLGVLSGETEGVLDSDRLSWTWNLRWIGLGEGDSENLF